MSKIGFIGLGMMGYPMAARLQAAGMALVVRDVNLEAQRRFAAEFNGAIAAESLASFGDCTIVVTMLPNSKIVDETVAELIPVLPADALVIDMSSSDPVHTRALEVSLRAAGKRLIDAPVSGGVKRAKDGTLAVMVGGLEADVKGASALLGHMGGNVIHVGPVGAGHAVKALNNYVSAAGLIATAEALIVADQFKVDPAVMVDVLNGSTGRNNTTENKAKQFMLSGSFNSGFSLALLAKDVGIAVSLGRAVHSEMTLGSKVREMCELASGSLGQQADHTELFRYVRDREVKN